jgi:hypothetical protein
MGFGNEVRVGLVEVSTDEAWADALGIGGDGTVEVGRQFVGAKVDSCVDDEEVWSGTDPESLMGGPRYKFKIYKSNV